MLKHLQTRVSVEKILMRRESLPVQQSVFDWGWTVALESGEDGFLSR